MINGVIVQKLQTLDDVLLELRSLGDVTTEQLEWDWHTRRAIERDLQVLIVSIGICLMSSAFEMRSWRMYKVDWGNISRVLTAIPQVVAAWGFGSAQSGIIPSGSDLDIGILWSEMPTLTKLADLRADLQAALQFDDIDLVSLNQASPVVRFEAVCGRLIFCRCAAQCVAFVSLTAREYEDCMAMIQRALDARATLRPALNDPHPDPLPEGEGTLGN